MNKATSITALLGPLAPLLDEPDVIEISCNPSLDVFVERFGSDPAHQGRIGLTDAERFLRWCATRSETGITPETPILSGRIPGTSHRIEALIPPVVDAPCFSIRRHAERVITLEDYIPDPAPRKLVADAIAARQNILIAGATGSGKTTLLNACLGELARIAPDVRLVIIEDTPEIRASFANMLCLRTSDAVSMDRLLVSALRLAPDRIVVGEVREGRVLMTLIKAWNTGHPGGLVTLHANSAADVLPRLRMLATEVTESDPMPALMASLDMIVFLRRGRERPEIATIATLHTDADGARNLETLHDTTS